MNMKFFAVILSAGLMLSAIPAGAEDASPATVPVSATETPSSSATPETAVPSETGDKTDAGILPDSPFYWLDQLVEEISLWVTFDAKAQTEKLEAMAAERKAEYQALLEKEKPEEAEKILKVYDKTMNSVLDKLENAMEDGTLDAADDDTLRRIERILEHSDEKIADIADGSHDRDSAHKQEAQDNMRRHKEEIAGKLSEKHPEVAKGMRERLEKQKEHLRSVHDKTQDDASRPEVTSAPAISPAATVSPAPMASAAAAPQQPSGKGHGKDNNPHKGRK